MLMFSFIDILIKSEEGFCYIDTLRGNREIYGDALPNIIFYKDQIHKLCISVLSLCLG